MGTKRRRAHSDLAFFCAELTFNSVFGFDNIFSRRPLFFLGATRLLASVARCTDKPKNWLEIEVCHLIRGVFYCTSAAEHCYLRRRHQGTSERAAVVSSSQTFSTGTLHFPDAARLFHATLRPSSSDQCNWRSMACERVEPAHCTVLGEPHARRALTTAFRARVSLSKCL